MKLKTELDFENFKDELERINDELKTLNQDVYYLIKDTILDDDEELDGCWEDEENSEVYEHLKDIRKSLYKVQVNLDYEVCEHIEGAIDALDEIKELEEDDEDEEDEDHE